LNVFFGIVLDQLHANSAAVRATHDDRLIDVTATTGDLYAWSAGQKNRRTACERKGHLNFLSGGVTPKRQSASLVKKQLAIHET
jgi:hypothetical protein